jgi:hypothetical protein
MMRKSHARFAAHGFYAQNVEQNRLTRYSAQTISPHPSFLLSYLRLIRAIHVFTPLLPLLSYAGWENQYLLDIRVRKCFNKGAGAVLTFGERRQVDKGSWAKLLQPKLFMIVIILRC